MLSIDEADIRTGLKKAYGLDVQSLQWVHSLYRKRVAARVQTKVGPVLKLKRFSRQRAQLLRLYHRCLIVDSMKQVKLPTWYKAKDGLPYVEGDQVRFYLIDWLDGRPYGHVEPDCYALGTLLRKLHQVPRESKGFDPPTLHSRLFAFRRTISILQRRHYGNLPSNIERFIVRESKSIERTITQSIETLKEAKHALAPVIIHGDVTVPNLIYQGREANLIDWERLNLGYAMEELAKTAMNTCNLSETLVESLLSGYDAGTLSSEEWAVFRAFLQIPREIVYLLHRAVRRKATKGDLAQWKLVMGTWRDRKKLIERFARR